MKNRKIILILFMSCLFNITYTMRRVIAVASTLKCPRIFTPFISYSPLTLLNVPRRSVAHINDYKNTYKVFKKNKHLSPLWGIVYAQSGALRSIYDINKFNYKQSATEKLVGTLFHQNGEQFRNTRLPTNPAYSLTPTLLGKIASNIGTLNNPITRKELNDDWKAQHLLATGSPPSNKKINDLLDLISDSHVEFPKKYYLPNTTENILQSMLYYIADGRKDISKYLIEIGKLPDTLSDIDYTQDDNLFSTEINIIRKKLDENVRISDDFLHENYEDIVAALLVKKEERLPDVIQAKYGFEGQKPRPNCVETSFHQLCNILLFNKLTKKFDFDLLPKSIKPNPKFIKFYALQNFNIDKINSATIGQEFMNIVSNHSFLEYHSGNYELNATVKNFIPLINYLFGTNATNLKELSTIFSDARRKVEFNQLNSSIFIDLKSIETSDSKHELNFRDGHAELIMIKRGYNDEECDFFNWYWNDSQNFRKYPQLASLIEIPPKFDLRKFETNYKVEEILHTMLSCRITHQSQFLEFLSLLCGKIKDCPYIEKYILYIANKFGDDHQYITSAIKKIIASKADEISYPIGLWCSQFLLEYLKQKAISDENIETIINLIKNQEKFRLEIGYFSWAIMALVNFLYKDANNICLLDIIDEKIDKNCKVKLHSDFITRYIFFSELEVEKIEAYFIKKFKDPVLFFATIYSLVNHPDFDIEYRRERVYQLIEKALKSGADPNANDNHRTLLSYALYKHEIRLISLLIKAGANVNLKISKDDHPLVYAMQGWRTLKGYGPRKREIIDALLSAGQEIVIDSTDQEKILKSLDSDPDIGITNLLIEKRILPVDSIVNHIKQ